MRYKCQGLVLFHFSLKEWKNSHYNVSAENKGKILKKKKGALISQPQNHVFSP